MQCNLALEVSQCCLFTKLVSLFPLMRVAYEGMCGVDASEEKIPKRKSKKRQ